MKYDALLVIDIQTALIHKHPYNEIAFIENVKQLLEIFRENKIPVIFIQHDGGIGDELEYGSEGWTIYKDVAPVNRESILDKRYNSSFRQTNLQDKLSMIHAKNIVLCGMQSEYCIDATCKVAFEYGYDITIFKDTTTTFDNDFTSGESLSRYYENKIWNNRFASVISMDDFVTETMQM